MSTSIGPVESKESKHFLEIEIDNMHGEKRDSLSPLSGHRSFFRPCLSPKNKSMEEEAKIKEGALTDSIRKRDVERFFSLVKEGARPDNKSVSAAFAIGNVEMAETLLKIGANFPKNTLNEALKLQDNPLVEKALESGARVDQNTLKQAIRNNPTTDNDRLSYVSNVEAVLSAGAKCSSKDSTDNLFVTFLDTVRNMPEIKKGINRVDPHLIKLLIKGGLKLDSRLLDPFILSIDSSKYSPFDLDASIKVVEVFVESGVLQTSEKLDYISEEMKKCKKNKKALKGKYLHFKELFFLLDNAKEIFSLSNRGIKYEYNAYLEKDHSGCCVII